MKSKKEIIIETAIRLFAENGYHNTSISKIATDANVSKGLMYNYFDSKEELLRYIFATGAEKLMANFDPNNDGVLSKEEFIFYVHDIFFQMQKERNYWILYFTIAMQPATMAIVANEMFQVIEPMTKELNAYFSEKGCDNPDAQTRYFIAVMDGVGMHYLLDPENYPIKKVIQKIVKDFV